jgi:TPR repeat protein
MKREDSRLLAKARRENGEARLEVGRRYLLGLNGFPLHRDLGVEYLLHPSLEGDERAARILVEGLPLHEVVERRLLDVLAQAARAGSAIACLHHGLWLALAGDPDQGAAWLGQGMAVDPPWRDAVALIQATPSAAAAHAALTQLSRAGVVDGVALCRRLIDVDRMPAPRTRASRQMAAQTLWELHGEIDDALALAVVQAVDAASRSADLPLLLPVELIERCLEWRALRGDAPAAAYIGRALCGLPTGVLGPLAVAGPPNLRRGAAWLMRAADAGRSDAWLTLHDLYADNRSSVANPQMAAFFLEKAAAAGEVQAQRRLGLRLMKTASALDDQERAVAWLVRAWHGGDASAEQVLESMVLPVAGPAREAETALAALHRADPALALRARLARAFGLTKLEALSLDLRSSIRSWGLVVGRNPFVSQRRLAAPRVIPAVSNEAKALLDGLENDVARWAVEPSTDLHYRNRSSRLRRVLARLALDEDLLFAQANARALEAVRSGVTVPAMPLPGAAARTVRRQASDTAEAA